LNIKFNDGTEGDVDLKETIFENNRAIFKQLRGIEEFKRSNVALNTARWFNELDLAPEFIKKKMAEQVSCESGIALRFRSK